MNIAANQETLIGVLTRIADKPVSGVDFPEKKIVSDDRERFIIRRTEGTGEFSSDFRYNVLRMKMFTLDGLRDGSHDGVWEPHPSNPGQPDKIIEELRTPFAPPKGPLDRPEGPVEKVKIRAYTKAIWRFEREFKGTLTAVGPAELHLVELSKDGAQLFLVSVAAVIVDGTGDFAGARGVKTAIGSTFLRPGASLFDAKDGSTFEARTVETFRIVLAADTKA